MNKLYVLCGLPFSGKTTFAKEVVKLTDFVRVDIDEVLFEMYGDDASNDDLKQEDWNKIYTEMYRRIRKALQDGKTVLHDAGNFTKAERMDVIKIATELGIETITIYVDTNEDTARRRLYQNRSTKERFDVFDEKFDEAVREMEPPTNSEKHLIYSSGVEISAWTRENNVV